MRVSVYKSLLCWMSLVFFNVLQSFTPSLRNLLQLFISTAHVKLIIIYVFGNGRAPKLRKYLLVGRVRFLCARSAHGRIVTFS